MSPTPVVAAREEIIHRVRVLALAWINRNQGSILIRKALVPTKSKPRTLLSLPHTVVSLSLRFTEKRKDSIGGWRGSLRREKTVLRFTECRALGSRLH